MRAHVHTSDCPHLVGHSTKWSLRKRTTRVVVVVAWYASACGCSNLLARSVTKTRNYDHHILYHTLDALPRALLTLIERIDAPSASSAVMLLDDRSANVVHLRLPSAINTNATQQIDKRRRRQPAAYALRLSAELPLKRRCFIHEWYALKVSSDDQGLVFNSFVARLAFGSAEGYDTSTVSISSIIYVLHTAVARTTSQRFWVLAHCYPQSRWQTNSKPHIRMISIYDSID